VDLSERAARKGSGRDGRIGVNLGQRCVARTCVGLPLGRAVIGVERVGIAVAKREREADVAFGGDVQWRQAGRGRLLAAAPGGEQQQRRQRQQPATKTRKHEANRSVRGRCGRSVRLEADLTRSG